MNRTDAIDEAVELAAHGLVIISTTNNRGEPHMAAASSLTRAGPDRIAVSEWFCPNTAENAVPGRAVSVVVWDSVSDQGHQIEGRVSGSEEIAILDGFRPDEDFRHPVPQVDRRVVIEVNRVLAFRKAPHSDVEE